MTTSHGNDPFARRPETTMSEPVEYDTSSPMFVRNGLGVAALIVGVLSVVLFFVPFLGLVLGVVAAVLGFAGLGRVRRNEASNKGVATAGLLLGILGVVLGIGMLFLFDKVKDCADPNLSDAEVEQCVQQRVGSS